MCNLFNFFLSSFIILLVFLNIFFNNVQVHVSDTFEFYKKKLSHF